VPWELATTRSFLCFSLRILGELKALSQRFDRYTEAADRVGDGSVGDRRDRADRETD
jgi:hypothetical protein